MPGNPALCKPIGLDAQVHVTCFQDTNADSVATFVSALHSQQLLFLLTPLEETWMLDSSQVDFRKAPNLFSREVICPVLSPAAAILENEKTLGTRLDRPDTQATV